ncbi:hypothetical protein HDV63DRAFT_258286 [Trichoderma sp. SZMC 28014]
MSGRLHLSHFKLRFSAILGDLSSADPGQSPLFPSDKGTVLRCLGAANVEARLLGCAKSSFRERGAISASRSLIRLCPITAAYSLVVLLFRQFSYLQNGCLPPAIQKGRLAWPLVSQSSICVQAGMPWSRVGELQAGDIPECLLDEESRQRATRVVRARSSVRASSSGGRL